MNLHAMLALQQGNAERVQQDNSSRPRQNGFMQAFAQASGKSSVGLPMSASPSPQASRALPPESVERHLQELGVSKAQLQHADMQALVADIVEQPALQEALETLTTSLATQAESGLANADSDRRLNEINASVQAFANASSVDGEPNALQDIAQRLALMAMFSETTTAASQPNAPVAPPQPDIATPVASPGWSRELGQQLAQLVQAAESTQTSPRPQGESQPAVQAQLQLNPAERGPLTVSLVTGEQGLQANFVSADPQVRQAIEQAAPQLREALAAQPLQTQPLTTQPSTLTSIKVEAPPQPVDANISAPLASPGWSRELGQQLAQLVQAAESAQRSPQPQGESQPAVQAKLQLTPAERGPLTVSLVTGEQGLQANFVSADPQVRQAIEQAAPQLQEALAAQPLQTQSTPLASINIAPPPQPIDASISSPLASPGWSRELGQQLAQLVQAAGTGQASQAQQPAQVTAELQLNPAERGPLTVSLVTGEQGLQANFVSADPQVRQAIEQAAPQLREALTTKPSTLASIKVEAPTQPVDASISAPLASPGWSRELGQQLAQLVQAAESSPRPQSESQPAVQAQLQLNPTERGPLTVSLVTGEQGLQANFVSADPQVRQAIEQAAPQLREALTAQPSTLASIKVEAPPQPVDASISAPLASPGWSRELSQQLAQLAQGAESAQRSPQPQGESQPAVQAQLQLTPAERGPLTVSLTTGEKGLQANFVSADPQVRQAIEQAAPQLREALAAQPTPATIKVSAPSQPTMANDSMPQRAEQIMAMLQSVANARQAQPSASENRNLSSGAFTWDSQTLMNSTQPTVTLDSSMPPTQGSRDLLLAALNAPSVGDRSRQNGFEFSSALTQGVNAQGLPTSSGQSNSAITQGSIQAPLTSAAWPRELGQQLIPLTQRGGEQQVKLNIHPAELGPLSVSIKMGEQGAQAHFLSAHAQVRQVLEMAIPQLREALAEQGINLADTSVGEQRQQEGGDAALAGGGGNQNGDDAASGDSEALTDASSPRQTLTLDGRVDLYA
ncbi:flagellar hook-length control protein FliK [Halomonas sp. LS-001]